MKILVPVDGSKHSEEAIRTSIELVKAKAAEILVITVVPSIGGMEDHEISPGKRDRHEEEMARYADEIIQKAEAMMAAAGVKPMHARSIMAGTSVPDAIVEFAEKEQIDLIVMGSHGMSTSERLRLGSVVTHVVKYSPCSVYVVKLSAA
jgi:nucleotide-binding universal stress UspA family protein